MKDFDVIVVGELNVDLLLNKIDSFPEMGKEKIAGSMNMILGSSSAIFASNLSSLGAKVAFIGKTGDDSFADLVLESLQRKGVNTDMIIRDPALATGATIILNYGEDRAMVTHPGAMDYLTIADVADESLLKARHLHFSSAFLQPGIKKDLAQLFAKAKKLGLTTSLDAQWDPAEKWDLDLKNIVPHVNVLLPNQKEAMYLTSAKDIDEALGRFDALGCDIVAVKMDNQGSLVRKNGKNNKLPAFLNKEVVDAIGAGDSYNAGFIFKYVQGKDLAECQRFANITGAINTTAAGGTTAFENYSAIMKLAQQRFGYTE
jgi:sugar/nucleoside kinase (ribokinase family)